VSHDFYSEINLHIVWQTKLSMPLLTPPVEAFVRRYLKHRLLAEEGVFLHAIGGIETHIHVALSIPPTVLISELVGRMKGASSHDANQQFGGGDKILEWQRGYGVVSFGTRHLPWVKAYVENQREHHARGTLQDRLELYLPPGQKEPS
jgi:putative transposase